MESSDQEYISRIYNCPRCRLTHNIKLPKNLAEDKPVYPFPYVFLHSSEEFQNLDDLLTILYIDSEMHIRAVEIVEVENSNIFSEELTKRITQKLMDKIVSLEEENLQLKELLSKLEVEKLSEIEGEKPIVSSIPSLKPQIERVKEITSKKPLIIDGNLKELDFTSKEPEFTSKEPQNGIAYVKTPEITSKEPQNGIAYVKTPEITSKEPVQELFEIDTTINVFIISTIGPGEKKQDLRVDLKNRVGDLKETIGNLYGLEPANFHLSSGGLTLDENLDLGDYNVEDGDDILIIPSSTAGIN